MKTENVTRADIGRMSPGQAQEVKRHVLAEMRSATALRQQELSTLLLLADQRLHGLDPSGVAERASAARVAIGRTRADDPGFARRLTDTRTFLGKTPKGSG